MYNTFNYIRENTFDATFLINSLLVQAGIRNAFLIDLEYIFSPDDTLETFIKILDDLKIFQWVRTEIGTFVLLKTSYVPNEIRHIEVSSWGTKEIGEFLSAILVR